MTKDNRELRSQRSIIEIHSLDRTVLINERSIKDRGNIGVIKGHQMIVTIEIKSYQRKTITHPRVECSGNSLVVGRLWLYHRLVATSSCIQTEGKTASVIWDIRDYMSRSLETF